MQVDDQTTGLLRCLVGNFPVQGIAGNGTTLTVHTRNAGRYRQVYFLLEVDTYIDAQRVALIYFRRITASVYVVGLD